MRKLLNKIRRHYYLMYTCIFIITAVITYGPVFLAGKSFVNGVDGFRQHYTALRYYGIYLRRIVTDLLRTHRIIIPDWDFCIGEGSDVLGTFHYYCIGDPLALLSALVPSEYTHYLYTALSLLRLYLSGISFSFLAFGTGIKNRFGVMAGAISYALCLWGLTCAVEHPYFVNPMIYFPLMILGVERIIKMNKPALFIFSTALSAMSNFYFFYVIALCTVFYTLARLLFVFAGQAAKGWLTLLRMGLYAVTGVLISGVITVPVVMSYIGDSRLSVKQPFHLFYPLFHYIELPGSFVSDVNSYATVCLSIPVLIAVLHLLGSRSISKFLKTLVIMSFIFILFPVFGRMFNLMAYMTNRWIFAFLLLCSYILAYDWDNMKTLTNASFIRIFLFGIILYCLCIILDPSGQAVIFAMLCLLFVSLAALMILQKTANVPANIFLFAISDYNTLFLFLALISSVILGRYHFAPDFNDKSGYLITNASISERNEGAEVSVLAPMIKNDSGIPVRISGRDLSDNANIQKGISSTQYYWSMSNPYVTKYRSDLEIPDSKIYHYKNYDDRTAPTALSAARYYIVPADKTQGIPYGLSKEDNLSNERFETYINNLAMPMSYCYDSYIGSSEYETLDPLNRQQILLETCHTNKSPVLIREYAGEPEDYSIPFDVDAGDIDITYTGSSFITTGNMISARLTFDSPSDSETYIRITGLKFRQTAEQDLYLGDVSADPDNIYTQTGYSLLPDEMKHEMHKSKLLMRYDDEITIYFTMADGSQKTIDHKPPEAFFSSARTDYLINLGYNSDQVTDCWITFPSRGVYSFDSLGVLSVPMASTADRINSLKTSTLENMTVDVDSFFGTINVDSPKMLTIAIPYSKGWHASVDGISVPVFIVNDHYLGLELNSGVHTVNLTYETPFKKTGAIMTLIGFLTFFFIWYLHNRIRQSTRVHTQ